MSYIMDLRKQVGSRPIISVGASVIMLNKENNVLLIKRSDNQLWGLPAASTELNESPEITAIREIKEETGLDVQRKALTLLNVFGGQEFFYTYPNGDQCSNVVISYLVKDYSGQLKTKTNETIDANFFSLFDLPVEIAAHEKIVLQYYIDTFLTI